MGIRRKSFPGNGGKLCSLWEVVSSLAQALTDARDQLVCLIQYQGGMIDNEHRLRGGDGNRNGTYNGKENMAINENENCNFKGLAVRRRNVPCSGARVRNVHRKHAVNHVAFGSHSEYSLQNSCANVRPATKALECSCKGVKNNGRGPPRKPKGTQLGLYLDPKSNILQIEDGKGGGGPMRICFSPQSSGSASCSKGDRPSSLECKRHCIGTQYAALLQEEAHRLRERRLADQTCKDPCSRPQWTRC